MMGFPITLTLKGKESAPKVTGIWEDQDGNGFKYKGQVTGLSLTMAANKKIAPVGETEKAKVRIEISVILTSPERFDGWAELYINKRHQVQVRAEGFKH